MCNMYVCMCVCMYFFTSRASSESKKTTQVVALCPLHWIETELNVLSTHRRDSMKCLA